LAMFGSIPKLCDLRPQAGCICKLKLVLDSYAYQPLARVSAEINLTHEEGNQSLSTFLRLAKAVA
jgi:hypothetical protein